MIRVLVVDDEPPSRKVIRELVSLDPSFVVIGEADSGLEAVDAIRRLKPDLVFLDVQMPGIDAFSVIRMVGVNRMPRVIFVTAHSNYTLSAFEVHAMDYIMKPVSPSRFKEALANARAQLSKDPGAELPAKLSSFLASMSDKADYPQRFVVRGAGRLEIVPSDHLWRIRAEKDYVVLHTDTKTYLMREKIGTIEKQLDPDLFVRIHRSHIVRISLIKELRAHGAHYTVLLQNGVALPVGRTYRASLIRLFSHL